jgi:hypothetical protein
LLSSIYEFSPTTTISVIKQTLIDHRREYASQYPNTLEGDLKSISDCFNIRLSIYFSNDFRQYTPEENGKSNPLFTAQLYYYHQSFDSIVKIDPNAPFNDPVPKSSLVYVKMCTWNLRGATDDIKRIMIDEELNKEKAWLVAIQESHLWCANLSTPNYKWTLGPQTQRRASRGVGFLIHRNFYPYVSHVIFPTPNLCILTFRLPFMNKPFYFLNIHKCSDGDINSGIETGK